jgi:4a-hydroxytetrahydrobiopterin dehydratase
VNRGQISAAVDGLGWRFVEGALHTAVDVATLADAVRVAGVAAGVAAADDPLRIDLRADRVVLQLAPVTERALRLAGELTAALQAAGHPPVPATVQVLTIAIDALDVGRVREFWRAVTGYVDESGPSDMDRALVDPLGLGPAIWFQQMDEPRRERNNIHLDISVPPDLAPARLAAALAAGGTLVSDARAPAFWVLADAEGNEACVCTWQGRD